MVVVDYDEYASKKFELEDTTDTVFNHFVFSCFPQKKSHGTNKGHRASAISSYLLLTARIF